ncbi:MAG: cation diffusion facilitator family transporter [Candidatus Dormibacteria bacterium]
MDLHNHGDPRSYDHGLGQGQLRVAFFLTAAILVVEGVAGIVAHSLSLLADAGHILTDVVALGFAWYAVIQASRPADARRTFGYKRVGILAAMFNGSMLLLVVLGVAYEAIRRLGSPGPIQGRIVIVAALVAIAVNGIIAYSLAGGSTDLNTRAAMLHVLGDLAASVGVVVAGVVVVATRWYQADALVSLAIAILITWSAVRIVRGASGILLEGTPAHIDLEEVRSEILGAANITSVHDLHVWSLGSEDLVLSCHVVVRETSMDAAEHLVRSLEDRICDRFGIQHTTIQAESCCPCAADCEGGVNSHNHPHAHLELSGLIRQHDH